MDLKTENLITSIIINVSNNTKYQINTVCQTVPTLLNLLFISRINSERQCLEKDRKAIV